MKRFVRKMPKRLVSILVVLGIVLSTLTVLTILPAGASDSRAVAGIVDDKTGAYAQWVDMKSAQPTANLILRAHDENAPGGGGEETTTTTTTTTAPPTPTGVLFIDWSKVVKTSSPPSFNGGWVDPTKVDSVTADDNGVTIDASRVVTNDDCYLWSKNFTDYSQLKFTLSGPSGITVTIKAGSVSGEFSSLTSEPREITIDIPNTSGEHFRILTDGAGTVTIGDVYGVPKADTSSVNTPAPSYESVSVQDVAPIEANYSSVMAGTDTLLLDWNDDTGRYSTESTVTKNTGSITAEGTSKDQVISTWGWGSFGLGTTYTGLRFTLLDNSGKSGNFRLQFKNEEKQLGFSNWVSLTTTTQTVTIDFSKLDFAVSSTTNIELATSDNYNITIGDIYGITGDSGGSGGSGGGSTDDYKIDFEDSSDFKLVTCTNPDVTATIVDYSALSGKALRIQKTSWDADANTYVKVYIGNIIGDSTTDISFDYSLTWGDKDHLPNLGISIGGNVYWGKAEDNGILDVNSEGGVATKNAKSSLGNPVINGEVFLLFKLNNISMNGTAEVYSTLYVDNITLLNGSLSGSGGSGTPTSQTFTATLTDLFNFDTGRSLTENISSTMFDGPDATADSESITDSITFASGNTLTINGNNKTVTWTVVDPTKYNELIIPIKVADNAELTTVVKVTSSAKYGSASYTPKLVYSNIQLDKTATWTGGDNGYTSGKAQITLSAYDPTQGETTEEVDVTLIVDRSDSMSSSTGYMRANQAAQRVLANYPDAVATAFEAAKNQTSIWRTVDSSGNVVGHSDHKASASSWGMCLNESHRYLYDMKNLQSPSGKPEIGSGLVSKILEYVNEVGVKNKTAVPVAQTDVLTKIQDVDNPKILDVDNSNLTVLNTTDENVTDSGWTYSSGAYSYNSGTAFIILEVNSFMKWCVENEKALSEDELKWGLQQYANMHLRYDSQNEKYTCISNFAPVMYENGETIEDASRNHLEVMRTTNYSEGCTDYSINTQEGLKAVVDKIAAISEESNVAYLEFGKNAGEIYDITEYNGQYNFYPYYGYNTAKGIRNSQYYNLSNEKKELLNEFYTYKDDTGKYTPYNIDTGDNTYYDQGLKDATQLINDHEGKNKKQLILFVSDGAPNDPNDNTFKDCVKDLINAASNGGTNEVYFYSVGIGLLDAHGGEDSSDRSYYLNQLVHHANNTTITGGTDKAVSAARYINITDSEQFANDVTSAIYEASSNAGIYFDKLSDYFAFPDIPTGTLTITNSNNTETSYEFSGAEFTFKNGQSITIDRTNKTIKWAIPDKSVNSKLTFDVVVDKGSYLTYNELYKSLNNGEDGQIATNSEAYFEFGSDSHADIISPKLDYKVEKAAPILSKDARWAQNYMTTGLADITLGVHDPEFSTSTTTSTSADVTIILDRSDSMTGSYMYLSAVKSAKEKEEGVTGAQGPNSDGKAGEDPEDVLNAGGYDACANENHLYVYKGKQITNSWMNSGSASTLKPKIVAYANECAGKSSPSPSEIGCLPLTDIGTVGAYFNDGDNRLSVDIQDSAFIINNLNSGSFATGWTIANGKYTNFNDDGWFVLNIHKFIDYCASNAKALTGEELAALRAASLIHVKPDSNDRKFELVSRYKYLETSKEHYYNPSGTEDNDYKYLYSLNYDDGCSDRLTNAQDGLARVVNTVLDGSTDSRLGYVEFKGSKSQTNEIYVSRDYYTKDTKNAAMEDIYTYRNEYSSDPTKNYLTPYETWTKASGNGTSYLKAIDGMKEIAGKLNNETKNTKQIILFISDGAPDDANLINQGTLTSALKQFGNDVEIEFYAIGMNLTKAEAETLNKLVDYAKKYRETNAKYVNVTSPTEFEQTVTSIVSKSIYNPVAYTDVLSTNFEFPANDEGFEIVHYTADTAEALEKIMENGLSNAEATVTKYTSRVAAIEAGIKVDGKTITWEILNPQKYHKLVFKAKLNDTTKLNQGVTNLATNNYAYYDRTPDNPGDDKATTVWTTKKDSPPGAENTFLEPGPLATPKVTKDISHSETETEGGYQTNRKLDLSSKNGIFYIILSAKDPNYDSSADACFQDTLSDNVEVNGKLPDGVTVDTTGKVITWKLSRDKLNNGATVAIPVKLTKGYMENINRLDAIGTANNGYFNSNASATLTSTYRSGTYTWEDTSDTTWLDLSNPKVAYQVSKVGLTVTKKDTAGTTLNGATFKLYEGTGVSGTALETVTTVGNGVATFNKKLTPGKTYTLVETQAPNNYELYGKVITFKAGSSYSVDSIHGSNVTLNYDNSNLSNLHFDVEVKNTLKAYNLPQSGGPGAIIIVCVGVALMIGAAVYFVYSRRSK